MGRSNKVARPGLATKSAVDAYEAAASKENKSRAASGGQQTTPATSDQGSTPSPTSQGNGLGSDIARGVKEVTSPGYNRNNEARVNKQISDAGG